MTVEQSVPVLSRDGDSSRSKPGLRLFAWLTWRQHGGLIVASVVVTFVLGTALLLARSGLLGLHCTPWSGGPSLVSPDSCGNVASEHSVLYGWSVCLLRVVVWLPILVAVFWGAPLVAREYELGTSGLAWGQAISARQWLLGKLAVLGSLAVVLGLALWLCAHPVAQSLSRLGADDADGRFGWDMFASLSPMVIPYALAALSVGVLCSVSLRKTLPAMALAGIVCAGLGVGTADYLRPHYASPVQVRYPGSENGVAIPGDSLLLVDNGWADSAGRPTKRYPSACHPDDDRCLAAAGISGRIMVYQPGTREAQFQVVEAALCLLLAAACGSLAVRRLRPR